MAQGIGNQRLDPAWHLSTQVLVWSVALGQSVEGGVGVTAVGRQTSQICHRYPCSCSHRERRLGSLDSDREASNTGKSEIRSSEVLARVSCKVLDLRTGRPGGVVYGGGGREIRSSAPHEGQVKGYMFRYSQARAVTRVPLRRQETWRIE